ncbi:MAG: hypothetical protein ACR2HH_05050 [Chthoniobacterales bacterium]
MKTCLYATLLFILTLQTSANAALDAWQNSSLGDWFVASNWTFEIGVPTATTDVEIGTGGTALINAPNAVAQAFLIGVPTSSAATTGSVILGASGGSRGSLTVSSEIDIGASSVAGRVANGTVTVSAGTSLKQESGNLYIGFGNQGSTGRLTITDPGSIMSTAAPTFIGLGNSHGNFTVQNGGAISTGPAESANDASSGAVQRR